MPECVIHTVNILSCNSHAMSVCEVTNLSYGLTGSAQTAVVGIDGYRRLSQCVQITAIHHRLLKPMATIKTINIPFNNFSFSVWV